MAASVQRIMLFVALPAATAAPPPTPHFPRQMSYKATMKVSKDSGDMFAGNNFSGTHYLNADLQVQRTEWQMVCPDDACGWFGPSPASVGINAHGHDSAAYQTVANISARPGVGLAYPVMCMKLPLAQPVFNESWAAGATYRGVHYLDGRICHRWSGTVPYMVQRVQKASDFYSDFYTNLPVASISADGAIDLRFSDLRIEPQPGALFDVTALNCRAPGPRVDEAVLV